MTRVSGLQTLKRIPPSNIQRSSTHLTHWNLHSLRINRSGCRSAGCDTGSGISAVHRQSCHPCMLQATTFLDFREAVVHHAPCDWRSSTRDCTVQMIHTHCAPLGVGLESRTRCPRPQCRRAPTSTMLQRTAFGLKFTHHASEWCHVFPQALGAFFA